MLVGLPLRLESGDSDRLGSLCEVAGGHSAGPLDFKVSHPAGMGSK